MHLRQIPLPRFPTRSHFRSLTFHSPLHCQTSLVDRDPIYLAIQKKTYFSKKDILVGSLAISSMS